ncbi:MAG: hypothetical protein WC662_00985 [Candidatus Paceibacterota bacterium]|jgi:ABC-type bacteriocin/lantibiotic exporter with double-glycine peptidase domain
MEIKFFKNKKSFKKDIFQINPNYFWVVILFFMLLAIIGAFIFGAQLFNKTNQEIVSQIENIRGQIETVKKERIEKVLKYFSEREIKSNDIINFPLSIIDPSL